MGLIALIAYMFYCVKNLRKTYNDESDLKVSAIEYMTVGQTREDLKRICLLRREFIDNII